jgi:hypothetical protein
MLFILVIIVATKMLLPLYPITDQFTVYRDAVYLSDSLLSEGYPNNWTANTSIIIPGIAGNNRINSEKLSEFSKLDYYKSKTLLHLTSDYIFFIKNSTSIINTGQCSYGYNLTHDANCTPILSTEHYDHLVRIDRIVIYNSTVLTLTVYTWT